MGKLATQVPRKSAAFTVALGCRPSSSSHTASCGSTATITKPGDWRLNRPAQACNARVPFVVVMTMSRPATRAGVNSRGEFPRSKSTPPVSAARIRNPSRSPASKTSGRARRSASASAISPTGWTPAAPAASDPAADARQRDRRGPSDRLDPDRNASSPPARRCGPRRCGRASADRGGQRWACPDSILAA